MARTPRDQGRIERAQAGAHERAQRNLAAIAKARDKGKALTAEALAMGKEPREVKDSWPVHAVENRATAAEPTIPDAGLARMARARVAAGLTVSAGDVRAMNKYPDGTPYDAVWRQACDDYHAGRPVTIPKETAL